MNMKDKPLVSICIPSYNSSLYIRETVLSVLGQTYENIELVICDDCSSDNTVDIIKAIVDSRIKLHQNEENLGVEGNWNHSMQMSTGKYIKVMGADDVLLPTCIEEQVKVLEDSKNSSVVLVSCQKRVIDKNGRSILSLRFPGVGEIVGEKAIKISLRKGTNLIGEPAAGLFKAEVLKKTGGFSGSNLYLIDLEFWSRILRYGNLYMINKTLYCFRVSSGSISASLGFRQFLLYNEFVTKLYDEKKIRITYIDRLVAKLMSASMVMVRQAFQFINHIRD